MKSGSPRPWVSANFAITWDGRISTRNRTPSDFSSPEDKRRFLGIRSLADAVLVSARTCAADGMTMGMPDASLRKERLERGQAEYPLRVLLSNSGEISPGLSVFGVDFSQIVIFSTERMPPHLREALSAVATLRLGRAEEVDLAEMMRGLHEEHGVRRLHCEGGGGVLRSLVAAGLLDEIYLTICPAVFGGGDGVTLTGGVSDFLPKSLELTLSEMEVMGGECFARYRVKGRKSA